MKVKFSLAEENKAVITGSSKGEVQLYTKEGKFFISFRLIKLENSDETQVTVYFRELQNLKVGQNSEVELLGKNEQSNIIFEAREGAILLAELKVENLSAYAITGGLLKISGNANTQNIEVRSKGIFRGEDLPGTNVKVTISGGGKVHINSNKLVNATAEAGGDIFIYGNPDQVVSNAGIGATIQKTN